LRRALAAANRHLVHANAEAAPGSKCSGSLTCAVFSENELFFGQVGAAYAFVQHPDDRFDIFPERNRLLIPLGGALPAVVHIGYTIVTEGSTILLTTTPAAESHARERWQTALRPTAVEEVVDQISAAMSESEASGSFVLVRMLPQAEAQLLPKPTSRKGLPLFMRKKEAAPTAGERQAEDYQTHVPLAPVQEASLLPHEAAPAAPKVGPRREPEPEEERQPVQMPSFLKRRPEPQEEAAGETYAEAPQPRFRMPKLKLPSIRAWFSDLSRQRTQRYRERRTTAERARLRQALKSLLPGKVEGVGRQKTRAVPGERPNVIGGLVLGLFLITMFITVTIYLQFGGRARAQELLEEAQAARTAAFASQDSDDWYHLRELASQIMTLDPQRTEAALLKDEAQQAIDALENAAMLDAHQLLDLGTAPAPRRLLIAGAWVYVLNTTTDEVIGLPLNEDRISAATDAPTPILKRGQTFFGEAVSHLVDLAWVPPGGAHPDGAIFIYSDGGAIYIYEPALGPGSITRQHIQGDLGSGMVTLMESFGEKLYLVQRQENQILTYEPVNGIYDAPRGYFASETAPRLQEALDLAIDGRVYLLMGDATVRSYFAGADDRSFQVKDLPDPQLQPLVMAVEPDPETGLIYLGDSQHERIVVLDKHGDFAHQFRLPGDALKQLEAIAVSESPHILYLIAANRLYAALLPEFVSQ
jgi:hypothetical protein